MSFTLTYKTLNNPDFLSGMQKLSRFGGWKEPKDCYNAARMSALIDIELKTMREVMGKFADRVKPADPKSPTDDEKNLMREEAEKFAAVEITVERHKVKLADTKGASLTPLELLALEPLLEGLE